MKEIEILKIPFHIQLKIAGEIRFGPLFYSLEIDGRVIREKNFGNRFFWDSQHGLLAIEEWYTTYGPFPNTGLTLINPATSKSAQFQKIGGYIRNIRFENGKIVFTKDLIGTGKLTEVESTISEVRHWQPIVFEK